jgi:hypothetical protein
MPFNRTPECAVEWWEQEGRIMVGRLPLLRYCEPVEPLRLGLNVSEHDMKARIAFGKMDGFGFQFLRLDLTGVFDWELPTCYHGGIVKDKELGDTLFHGCKYPMNLLYSRVLLPSDNPKAGMEGFYHSGRIDQAMQYAKPIMFGTGEWRCLLELKVFP